MSLIYFLLMMIPIVVIHELGHYWVGRLSGIKPEVFSVGFGPEIYARTDKHGTKWRFAALPLGGFVKFAPDAQGTNFPNVEPQKPPYLAPFWGKIATVLAGPVANFIMSFVLFFLFASFHGPQSNAPIISEVHNFSTEIEAGDRITAVNGQEVEGMDEVYALSADAPETIELTVQRGDGFENLEAPNPNLPFVGAVIPGEPAERAGLQEGDQIVALNGQAVDSRAEVIDVITKGEAVDVSVKRNGDVLDFNIEPEKSSDGVSRVGVYFAPIYETQNENLGLWDSARYAFSSTNWVLVESFKGIRDLVTGYVSIEAMSGPVGMSRVATDAALDGTWTFIWLMAMISSAIGFLNLLPIPILDGGHIVLMTYERIFGRLPNQMVLNVLFLLGIGLLLGVLMTTTINEVFRQ